MSSADYSDACSDSYSVPSSSCLLRLKPFSFACIGVNSSNTEVSPFCFYSSVITMLHVGFSRNSCSSSDITDSDFDYYTYSETLDYTSIWSTEWSRDGFCWVRGSSWIGLDLLSFAAWIASEVCGLIFSSLWITSGCSKALSAIEEGRNFELDRVFGKAVLGAWTFDWFNSESFLATTILESLPLYILLKLSCLTVCFSVDELTLLNCLTDSLTDSGSWSCYEWQSSDSSVNGLTSLNTSGILRTVG